MPLKLAVTKAPAIDLPKTPFLENQVQMTPEMMEFVWDNWRSHPGLPTPKSGKRWGIFSLKKIATGPPPTTPTSVTLEVPGRTIYHQRSKLLKKKIDKTKSTPNLKGRALRSPPEVGRNTASDALPTPRLYSSPVPAVPHTPLTATSPSFLGGIVADSVDSSAVYFTVDPTWDESKGDAADMFFIPFPSAHTLYTTSRPTLDRVVEISRPRERAMTQFLTKPPRTAGCVKDTDNETSFLFLE
ncbi:hypothetical protein DXG03_003771 [Asterophora parasitica]|uniref:Uncharacterized protein n=1 Tax=Asterophora parasitica TaxID=117018 RepID=A0A9P7G183_9AGAR|nr:hypothetical protein DXG03_003771 [Asterophora parasitica]